MKTLAFAILVVAAACSQKNANYCPGNPDNNCLEDAATGDGSGSNMTCPAKQCVTGVCDTVTHTCGQCAASDTSACTGTTPFCSTEDTCRGCISHGECASTVCLPTGACGDEGAVAYVADVANGGTVNAVCTHATPCTSIAAALATNRAYIKIKGTIAESVLITTSSPLTFLGDSGATITAAGLGPLFTVSGTANVSIYDLDLKAAAGTNGDGIYMPTGTPTVSLHRVTIESSSRYGVYAQSGTINIERSTIMQNTGGGLNLASVSFDIKNSFVVANSGVNSGFGGININQVGTTHSIEFTTIANNGNAGNVGVTNGVSCAAVATSITFSNNIIYNNLNDPQIVGGNCNYTWSDIGPTAQNGTGNMNVAPGFVDPATYKFHLMSGSPVKDMADPAASQPFDFDGNPRPQFAHSDMGADEILMP